MPRQPYSIVAKRRPRVIALTFDDGPSDETTRILDCFEQHGCVGTFFVLGRNIPGRENVLQRMVSLGCEVGNHTYTHPRLSETTDAETETELRRCSAEIVRALSAAPRLMRPPYGDAGRETSTVARRLGLTTVHWSVPTRDWDASTDDVIVERVLAGARPGGVVVMHDGAAESGDRNATVAAVARIVPALIEQGYRLVTVSDLLSLDRRARREVVMTRHGPLRRAVRAARARLSPPGSA